MRKVNFILLPLTFIATSFIYFYKLFISPYFPKVCRFTPSCSTYALEAVKHYGVFKGSFLALKRILKCHPFHKGGYDPLIK